MKHSVRQLLAKSAPRARRLSEVRSLYLRDHNAEQIADFQLRAFNSTWEDCTSRIPFYRSWAAEHSLPRRVDNLQDLNAFPKLNKKIIMERFEEVCEGLKIDGFYSTGGSAGTPARFPRSKLEANDRFADLYAARSALGIEPGSTYVHLWGHSHLFGEGRLASYRKAVRRVKDIYVGGLRLNAYDLSVEASVRYAEAISGQQVDYIIGYTSALVRIATAAMSLSDWKPPKNLRTVIVTAETVTDGEIELLESVFEVPCHIEYGAAETGVLAHSQPGSHRLRTMWASNIIATDEESSVLVTTIRRRLFPLINYELGDYVTSTNSIDGSVLEIARVDGRAQESVTIPTLDGGTKVGSAIMVVHIAKALAPVNSVQVYNEDTRKLHLFYTVGSGSNHSLHISDLVRGLRLSNIDADPSRIEIHKTDRPIVSRAGKVKVLISDGEAADILR